MKINVLLCFLASATALSGQTLLTDDFSGSVIDTAKWSTILASGSSSVVQSGGFLITTDRGILATANQFTTPFVISGSFTMLDDLEHFNIVTRTDLSVSSSDERPGLLVSFANDGDEISIQRYTSATDWDRLAVATYSLTTGQSYSFSITDTGSSVTLAIDGVDQISGTSSYATGGFIAFYSREFPSTATKIDSLTISAIPESSSMAAIAGIIALCAAVAWRKAQPDARANDSACHVSC